MSIQMNRMNDFLKKHKLKIAGALVGAVAGYAYYYFVGCSTGTCPIKSNPYAMTAYGALMGYLLFDIIKLKPKKDEDNQEVL
ncbi:MAG: hypothetical protein RIS29_1506 [Bacteroidota bacterium]|jgi:hypothetical protein